MNFSRTLIIKPSSMGDIVQALPVLTALKEARGEAHVTWLVSRSLAALLEGHPRINRLLYFDRDRLGRMWWSRQAWRDFRALAAELQRHEFTLVLDLQGLFRSGLLARVTQADDVVGFAGARELAPAFYTRRISVPQTVAHAAERYLLLAREVGLPPPKATDHLPVPAEARAAARRRLAEAGLGPDEPFLAVCADARWPTKRWPPERFARVLDRLRSEAGARAVLVGSPSAAPIGRAVAGGMAERPLDLTGRTTLKELVALIAEARAMVTNDSGPMHIAAVLGTPVVALFGPTDPRRTGPWGPGLQIALEGRAPCRPCRRRRWCRPGLFAEVRPCLATIEADEVARRLLEVWRRAAGPAAPR